MNGTDLRRIVRQGVHVATRRAALRALGVAGIGSAIETLGWGRDDAGAKKNKRKCKKPKAKCGKTCVSLDSNAHCGRCGNGCGAGESCRGRQCVADDPGGNCPPGESAPANRSFPQRLGYGVIRPNRWNQDEQDAHVRAAYDRWKSRYLVPAGCDGEAPRYRIALGQPGSANHAVTVSEGQGYGMVIVAHLAGYDPDAQAIFDGFWRFRLAHPSEIDNRLMDWRVPGGEGNDSAFDGDGDIAYGLLLADTQWGSGSGPIDYRAEFDRVLAGVLASTIGPASRLPMLGDWVNPDGATYNQDTPRTSDFMLGHFRAFGRASGDGVWDTVVDACQDVVDTLQTSFSPDTGLLPDFVQEGPRPASPNFLEDPHDGDYFYNAGRDPWRLGTDALLNGDSRSADQARKIAAWAKTETGGNPSNLRAGYRLDGTTWADTNYFTTFFAAPLGVAAMTDPAAQDWLNDIYAAVFDRTEDYYEDTVTLLCLLAMTGNFWDPAP